MMPRIQTYFRRRAVITMAVVVLAVVTAKMTSTGMGITLPLQLPQIVPVS